LTAEQTHWGSKITTSQVPSGTRAESSPSGRINSGMPQRKKGVRHRERPGRSGSGSGSDRRHLDKTHALAAVKAFADPYGAKLFGKAVAKIIYDVDELLAFLRLPPSTGSICAPRTRHRAASDQDYARAGFEGGRAGHRLQGDHDSPRPVAGGQNIPPRRARPRRLYAFVVVLFRSLRAIRAIPGE
jgi:hypothetical protein